MTISDEVCLQVLSDVHSIKTEYFESLGFFMQRKCSKYHRITIKAVHTYVPNVHVNINILSSSE